MTAAALGRAAPIIPSITETERLALNIARNTGWPVFPCRWADKRPARPKAEGGNGFKDASTDPEQIAELWRRWPGALIGIPTGQASGMSILDVDVKHDTARAWWFENEIRLPTTRTFRTRGGGLHLAFRHAPGVRNIEGRPIKGVDVRGEGGYFVFWFAAGFECVDTAPPAPWPHWLTRLFWSPPVPRKECAASRNDTAPLADRLAQIKTRAIELVRGAEEGQRHNRLRAAARLLGGIQGAAGFNDPEAIRWLIEALPPDANVAKSEATAAWGLSAGRASPIDAGAGR